MEEFKNAIDDMVEERDSMTCTQTNRHVEPTKQDRNRNGDYTGISKGASL